jgi:carbon storage regulator CsrA
MLVLTRKTQQRIQIGENITITVLRVKGRSVRIGIEAPTDVKVLRAELPTSIAKRPTADETRATAAVTARHAVTPAGHKGQTIRRDGNSAPEVEQPLAAALLRRRTPGVSATASVRCPDRVGASLCGLVSRP